MNNETRAVIEIEGKKLTTSSLQENTIVSKQNTTTMPTPRTITTTT